uniref:ID713 n=1 Tax=Bradyrhizobium japonicum TaxID=375 RepID=Q9AMZ1_BRAJP|nr:ID713 [Bradyrhizobium japonicum]
MNRTLRQVVGCSRDKRCTTQLSTPRFGTLTNTGLICHQRTERPCCVAGRNRQDQLAWSSRRFPAAADRLSACSPLLRSSRKLPFPGAGMSRCPLGRAKTIAPGAGATARYCAATTFVPDRKRCVSKVWI